MSKDLEALRRKFYDDDDDDDDRFSSTGASSSTAVASTSAPSAPAGPSRARQAQSGRTARAAPYPDRGASSRARGYSRASGGRNFADDPLGGLGLGRAPAPVLDGMDVDPAGFDVDADRRRAPRTETELSARQEAALEIEAEEMRGPGGGIGGEGAGVGSGSDVQRLLRVWQAERHAPTVLPAQGELLGRVLDAIRQQSADVQTLRAAGDLSEEDHYRTMLVQTEVERVRFVVRSYVRTRLFKIEQHAAYITQEKDVQARLTEAELRHAQRYAELLVSQLRTTVLRHLPEAQQALDDEVPTMPSMISEPDLDKPVFTRFRAAEGHVELADGSALELARGATVLVPFRAVEQQVLRGEAELI